MSEYRFKQKAPVIQAILDKAAELPTKTELDIEFANVRGLVETTWAELVALRDGGDLVPGRLYRITDYVTRVKETENDFTGEVMVRSAGHAFDVLVVAIDGETLSEDALATQHAELEGDYFYGCRMEAWELKYCLDNDTERFAWADDENGTGVVYWMKDEWGNEAPYDFKNVQFKRWKVSADVLEPRTGFVNKYLVVKGNGINMGGLSAGSEYIWAFTFSSNNAGNLQTDMSLSGLNHVTMNVISPCLDGDLPNVVFFGEYHVCNTLGADCRYVTFANAETGYCSLGIQCRCIVLSGDGFILGDGNQSMSLQGDKVVVGNGNTNVYAAQLVSVTIGDRNTSLELVRNRFGRIGCFVERMSVAADAVGFVIGDFVTGGVEFATGVNYKQYACMGKNGTVLVGGMPEPS